MNNKTLNLTTGALIGALYIVLTLVSQTFGLASGAVQLSISEALTILPLFTWAAVPGLTVGCIVSDMITGCALWDTVFGSLATLAGALGTYWVGRRLKDRGRAGAGTLADAHVPGTEDGRGKKKNRAKIVLGAACPIAANVLVIPLVLMFVYGAEGAYWYFLLTIAAGEILSCGVLGGLLYRALDGKIKWPV